MNEIKEKIDELIEKYCLVEDKELFRLELEILVAMAEKEQMVKDRDGVVKIMGKAK